MMNQTVKGFCMFLISGLMIVPEAFGQQVVPLYSGPIPNSKKVDSKEIREKNWGGLTVRNITVPTMTVFLPDPAKSVKSAVIIFPGGGYYLEAIQSEGTNIAKAFAARGVAGFVVKYRLPTDSTMIDKSVGPLEDAQQAIMLVRERAKAWGLDTSKIGIMGFSAGGHVASTAGTHFNRHFISDKDGVGLRPDFMILAYPVISMTNELAHLGSRDNLLGKNPSDSLIGFFSGELNVTHDTPPTFLIQAEDDKTVSPDNSIDFFEALRHHDVPAELVIIPKGGHGFANKFPPDKWMEPLFSWMRENGWMK